MPTKSKKKVLKPSEILKRSLALFGSQGQRWTKGEEEVEPGDMNDNGTVYPEGAFCAIGAVRHINTKNENKAVAYLAFAVKMEEDDLDQSDEDAITDNNDDEKTKFSDVKRWFLKAIKFAKANGE